MYQMLMKINFMSKLKFKIHEKTATTPNQTNENRMKIEPQFRWLTPQWMDQTKRQHFYEKATQIVLNEECLIEIC